jgi:hypothetical protein
MEQPPNPLDSQDPLDDPMLDALERSIENPPGFVDPLAEHGEQLMDSLAQQLDKLEASIENTPPLAPESDAVMDGDEATVLDDESATSEASSLVEGHEPPETIDDQTSPPPDLQDPSANTPKPIQRPRRPPRRGGGSSRRKRGLLFKKRIPRLSGRTVPGRNWNIRFCPESRERIDEKRCKSCEKYRHWPEGTKEESRECWYDWQTKPRPDESEEGEK